MGLYFSTNNHIQVSGYSNFDQVGNSYDCKSTVGYCYFVGGNLVSQKSKKQIVVSTSSAKSKYRTLVVTTYEIIWNKQLLEELKINVNTPMKLFYDSKVVIHISNDSVFHEYTKHIEIDLLEKTRGAARNIVQSWRQMRDRVPNPRNTMFWLKKVKLGIFGLM